MLTRSGLGAAVAAIVLIAGVPYTVLLWTTAREMGWL